jgi:hypothetical protein
MQDVFYKRKRLAKRKYLSLINQLFSIIVFIIQSLI